MTRRRLVVIAVLLLVGIAAWIIPYDFASHCAKVAASDLAICVVRNGGITIGRVVPLLLALVVALKIRPKAE
jgi:hypothetical protein